MRNEPVKVPEEMEQAGDATEPLGAMEHEVSDVWKPAPRTSTVAATWATEGASVIIAEEAVDAVTWKLAEAESPPDSALAVIVYDPPGTLATVKDPVKSPFDTKQVGAGYDATAAPINAQVESAPLNS